MKCTRLTRNRSIFLWNKNDEKEVDMVLHGAKLLGFYRGWNKNLAINGPDDFQKFEEIMPNA